MGLEYYKAYVAYMTLTRGATLIDNEDCVKETINKEYWTVKALLDNLLDVPDNTLKFIFLGGAIAFLFVVSLVLFLIYIKRQYKTTDEVEEPFDTIN